MKRYTFLFFLLILFFTRIQVLATHIVGGEMNYHYLGNNQYQITLTVYRDCYNGQAPFDDPASIGLYDGNGNLLNQIYAYITMTGYVPNAINSPCLDPPTNVCYEVAQYVFTTVIPTGSGAVTIAYQRCCRNYSIMNIANVQSTGATYMAVVTDPSIAAVNSNPVFNEWPPTFICKDAPFTFDHSATDPDGDSLVYELSYPYEGGDIVNRAPDPPLPPPYTPVTFLPQYSLNNVLGGTPMVIDPVTGLLKATPNSEGQFVYGVSVKEYRNGVYLGETRRDFQVNVVSCPQLTVASIYSPTIACGSLDANFINNSYNATIFRWNFGDSTTFGDTSSLKNPVYTYPDTGDYWATLVAYSPNNSLCNDTVRGLVHVYPEFLAKYYLTNDHCSNVFSFTDQSYGIHGQSTYWSWNFGDNTFSPDTNPVHTFLSPGQYNVRLITSADSACVDTMDKIINVLQNPVSHFSILLDTCSYTIQTKDSSLFASSFRWDFGDYSINYNRNSTHHFNIPGQHNIQLIVSTDSACIDTSDLQINIPPLPIPGFRYDVAVCDSEVYFHNMSQNAVSYIWGFGDGDLSNEISPTHIYSMSGYVPVRLIAESQFGCKETLDNVIFFIAKKNAYFDYLLDTCEGVIRFVNVTKSAAYYYWDFGDGINSTDQNPVHRYVQDGEHEVTLFVNRESQCPDSIMNKLNFESPLGEKVFIPNTFTPNGDGHNDFFELSIFRPCEVYKLTIYNRWGQKVLENEDATNVVWDGTFNGEKLPEDVYIYVLESPNDRKQGIITILR